MSFTERLAILIEAKAGGAIRDLERLSGSTEKIGPLASRHGRLLGLAMTAGAGVAGYAVGKFATDSIRAFREAEASQNRLEYAFRKFPATADVSIDELRKLNSEIQRKTRLDDDSLAAGQAVLAQYGLTGQQLKEVTPLLADYAVKTGKDAPDAATTLGKALLGNGRALKDIGVAFHNTGTVTGNYTQLVGALREKVGGFATKEGQTFDGKLERLKLQTDELKEKVGGALIPAMSSLVDFTLNDVIPAMGKWERALEGVGSKLSDLADKASRNFFHPVNNFLQGLGGAAYDFVSNKGGTGDKGSGASSGLKYIGKFAEGGVVPGAYGQPGLAVVHGGEFVVPTRGVQLSARASNTRGSVVNHITVSLPNYLGDRDAVVQEVRSQLLKVGRRNPDIFGGLA